MTALTPGRASASRVSIFLIRACGYGLRTILAQSMPGRLRSAPKVALPVTRSGASTFANLVPITLCSMTSSLLMNSSVSVGWANNPFPFAIPGYQAGLYSFRAKCQEKPATHRLVQFQSTSGALDFFSLSRAREREWLETAVAWMKSRSQQDRDGH